MIGVSIIILEFDYPLKLHHTQTDSMIDFILSKFDYPLKLHHTQTPRGKFFKRP